MQELTSVMGCVSDQVVMWYYFAFSGTTVLTFILFIFNHRFQNLILLMLALFFPQVAGIHFHILIMFVGNSITQWKVFNYLATAYVTVFLWRRANARNVRLYYHRIGSTPTFLYFDLYLYSAYAAHYVYVTWAACCPGLMMACLHDLVSRNIVFDW